MMIDWWKLRRVENNGISREMDDVVLLDEMEIGSSAFFLPWQLTRSNSGIFYIGWKAAGAHTSKGTRKLQIVRASEVQYVAIVPSMIHAAQSAAKGGPDSGYRVYWFIPIDHFRIDDKLTW